MTEKKFIFGYREGIKDKYSIVEGTAQSQLSFIHSLSKELLNKDDWVVYEVSDSSHKDKWIASGQIDDILEE